MNDEVLCDRRDNCPFTKLGIHINNMLVFLAAKKSPINRHIVRVNNCMSDEQLCTRTGESKLVENHVCHGGVGRYCKAAYDYLINHGCHVEAEMVPVEVQSGE